MSRKPDRGASMEDLDGGLAAEEVTRAARVELRKRL